MNSQLSQEPVKKITLKRKSDYYPVRYKLIDQRRFNFVTYKDLLTDELTLIHALELVRHDALINGFNSWDACQIGVIAGNACYDPAPPAHPDL